MVTRRIIPCLDVRGENVVKGVRFEHLKVVGDPVERAAAYARAGADELCFLDVGATVDGTPMQPGIVRAISKELFIPFTVGGGVRGVADARALLRAGADKVALNTAALERPALLAELAAEFGRQCVVLSIDTTRVDGRWSVTTHGAAQRHALACVDWARMGAERGAGEVLLNAVDTDGARRGFSLDITRAVVEAVPVPVIASGGAGEAAHFIEMFTATGAAAALAASIFHDGTWTPQELKHQLAAAGIEVRP